MRLPFALRSPLRSLLRSPFLYAAAVAALAIGVAAPTTMFTIARGVLRELPVPAPGRLVHIARTDARFAWERRHLDGRWFAALAERQRSLAGVAAHELVLYDVAGGSGLAERRQAARLTPNAFGVLGVRPLLGRDFTAADGRPGADRVVIIAHDLWRARFAGEAAVLGTRLRLDGVPHTVIGIMPAAFRFPERQQLWTPFQPTLTDTAHPMVAVFARRAAGVTLAQVHADLDRVGGGVRAEWPEWAGDTGLRAAGYGTAMIAEDERLILRVLTLLFAFVLVIACANVTNLLLARASARTPEVALRAALGAGGRRLALEQLAEAAWIALPGALLGLALSRVGVAALTTQLAEFLPFWARFELAGGTLLFTTGCMLAATVAAGLVPAWQALRLDPQRALQERGRGTTFRIGRLARALLVLELALSVCLLIVAAIATRGVLALGAGRGYDAAHVATARWTLRGARYDSPAARREHLEQVLARVRARAGVTHAAAASHLPDVWSGWRRVGVEGDAASAPDELPLVHQSIITPGYFDALAAPLLEGRDFSAADRDGAAPVVIINRPFRERFLAGRAAIGARLRLGDPDGGGTTTTVTVIGVAPHLGVRTEVGDISASIYLPFAQQPPHSMALVVRTAGESAAFARALPALTAAVDPNVAVYEALALPSLIREMRRTERAFGTLFIVIGVAALLLAAVGLAGLMAYSVRRRTRELGIRAALGATRGRLVWTALRSSAAQLVVGGAIGTGLGMVAARLLGRNLLLGVAAADPAVLAAVPLTLLVVGLLAAWAPARHAAGIPVATAVREE